MNIVVTGRHLEVTPSMKSYAEEKIRKFEKYLTNITEAVVTLSVQKYRHKAEVLLKAGGVMIQAEGVTEEIYASIDEVHDKLERQIKKYKDKLVSKRKVDKGGVQAVEAEHPDMPSIIRTKRFEMKPMSPDEAAMQMDLLDKDFFIFTNGQSGDINVIYKRNDGNFGLIEPLRN